MWTEALFIGLTMIFLMLSVWRIYTGNFNFLSFLLISFSLFFLFCSVNYRTLIIHLTQETLDLRFGIIEWTIPIDNIDRCSRDKLSALQKYGGAGIHFMSVHGRYRAFFNFLEYPRVVITLKRRSGPVQDISFSTSHPEELVRLIKHAAGARSHW